MSRQVAELEAVMKHLIAEHGKLVQQLDAQQAAMKALDFKAIDAVSALQESTRLRIAAAEVRRRNLVAQIALPLRIESPSLLKLAEALPQSKQSLLALRDELRGVMEKVATRATIAGRLAGAVLGHLNTAVRVLAGAVEQAGTYTRHGVHHVGNRIGVIEAVG